MAAAALLRSVARKLARAPPPHPLARGLRDGARSGPGSLPPPTSGQVRTYLRPINRDQGMGDRLVVGMAAAAGLRSGAGLPSLARKIPRAPPQGYQRRLHSSTSPNPGASGCTPPPTSDKDAIENPRLRLRVGAAGCAVVYLYFWALPEAKAHEDDLTHFIKKLESILDEDAEIMQSSGHGGTRVDGSEADQVLKAFPVMKEIADVIKDIQAIVKDHQAAAAELTGALESSLSEGERKE